MEFMYTYLLFLEISKPFKTFLFLCSIVFFGDSQLWHPTLWIRFWLCTTDAWCNRWFFVVGRMTSFIVNIFGKVVHIFVRCDVVVFWTDSILCYTSCLCSVAECNWRSAASHREWSWWRGFTSIRRWDTSRPTKPLLTFRGKINW